MEDFRPETIYELRQYLRDGKAIDALYPSVGEGQSYFKAIVPVHFQGTNNAMVERTGEVLIEADTLEKAYEKWDETAEAKVAEMKEEFEKELLRAKFLQGVNVAPKGGPNKGKGRSNFMGRI